MILTVDLIFEKPFEDQPASALDLVFGADVHVHGMIAPSGTLNGLPKKLRVIHLLAELLNLKQ